jgi:hypothetical protein
MQQSIIAAGASSEEAVLLVTEFSGEILARKGSLRQIQTCAGDVEQAISVWRQRQVSLFSKHCHFEFHFIRTTPFLISKLLVGRTSSDR